MVHDSQIMPKAVGYQGLVHDIGTLLAEAHSQVAKAVNTALVATYWKIGRHIVEFEQKDNARAECGSNLLNRLSADLKNHKYR